MSLRTHAQSRLKRGPDGTYKERKTAHGCFLKWKGLEQDFMLCDQGTGFTLRTSKQMETNWIEVSGQLSVPMLDILAVNSDTIMIENTHNYLQMTLSLQTLWY